MPEIFFNGSAGRIEGRYTESSNKHAPVALVLHPHSVYGGTMNNKVVYELYRCFAQNGFTVLRINFRGVGNSEGTFDNGVGELVDAASALDWLETHYPLSNEFWLAGFSFGAWIAMQLLMRRPEVNNFVITAPPVNKYDFSFLTSCPIPGLVVAGDQDSVVTEESIIEFVEKIAKHKKNKIEYHAIYGADHFFREKINELNKIVNEYISSQLSVDSDNQNTKYKIKTALKSKKILLD